MSIKNLSISRNQLIIILILIVSGLILLSLVFFSHAGKKVRVSHNGEIVEELSLETDTEREYNFDGQVNTLVIKEGQADVIHANCENQICVNTPAVSETGEVIACLPHSLIIEVIE